MDGIIPNNNWFQKTPFEIHNGDISSGEYSLVLNPGYRVQIISNTDIHFVLSKEQITGSVDYTSLGVYVPADTFYEFDAHCNRTYFYCEALSASSDLFLNLAYIGGFSYTA